MKAVEREVTGNPNGDIVVKRVVPPTILLPPTDENSYDESGQMIETRIAPQMSDYNYNQMNAPRNMFRRSTEGYYPSNRPSHKVYNTQPALPPDACPDPVQRMPMMQMLMFNSRKASPYSLSQDSGGQVPAIALLPAQDHLKLRKSMPGNIKQPVMLPPVDQSDDLLDQVYAKEAEAGNDYRSRPRPQPLADGPDDLESSEPFQALNSMR